MSKTYNLTDKNSSIVVTVSAESAEDAFYDVMARFKTQIDLRTILYAEEVE